MLNSKVSVLTCCNHADGASASVLVCLFLVEDTWEYNLFFCYILLKHVWDGDGPGALWVSLNLEFDLLNRRSENEALGMNE